jgi:hypothetical protein
MQRRQGSGISGGLRQARTRIERWRRTREKRSPMPEPLWEAAIALAKTEGVYRTARALSLNYQSLRARVAEASPAAGRAPGVPRGFVELAPPPSLAAPGSSGPVLEWVDRGGAKLTIRLPVEPVVDVERLAVHLLERERR